MQDRFTFWTWSVDSLRCGVLKCFKLFLLPPWLSSVQPRESQTVMLLPSK